jgi:hypothetical protein
LPVKLSLFDGELFLGILTLVLSGNAGGNRLYGFSDAFREVRLGLANIELRHRLKLQWVLA